MTDDSKNRGISAGSRVFTTLAAAGIALACALTACGTLQKAPPQSADPPSASEESDGVPHEAQGPDVPDARPPTSVLPSVSQRPAVIPASGLVPDVGDPTRAWSFDVSTLDDDPVDAGQYPRCMSCRTMPVTKVAGCPSRPIGTGMPCQSFCHIQWNTPIDYYLTDPPASGNHYPGPERQLGEHTVPVPRGSYVHSMEHGAVILAYNCPEGCATQLQVLRQALAQRSREQDKVILTPDPLMKSAHFAASSWTWVYAFNEPDLATLLCFVDQHMNHGRENKKL